MTMPRKFNPVRSRFDILSRGNRRKRGEMNRNEQRWADALTSDENVYQWWYEPFSLRLSHPETGQPATLTPDFLVLLLDGTTYVDDVKSGGMDDKASIVRMKTAAELFPLWRFRLVKPRRKKDGGGWDISEV